MIVDIHGYAVAMAELYSLKAHIFGERGWGLGAALPDDDVLRRYTRSHLAFLDEVGTDIQFVAPRPYHLTMSGEPAGLIRLWTARYNEAIAKQCAMSGGRLFGIAALPQVAGEPVATWLDDLDRCCDELGFIGVLVNPDPGEGDGRTPGLGTDYWYPLWERLVARDIPALIISGACRSQREGYSAHYITESSIAVLSLLENPRLFTDFPTLKLIITYGAGSIPYQIDRWRARRWRQEMLEDFDTSLRRLYFDTVVHGAEALGMLLRVCGPDRCLFGTQRPGAASVTDPRSGERVDDIKPKIDRIPWLTPEQRADILEGNARRVFTRFAATAPPAP